MRQQIKIDWILRVMAGDKWMDEIIFNFADIFPDEGNEALGMPLSGSYKCADVIEAAGVKLDQYRFGSSDPQLNQSFTLLKGQN